MGVMYNVPSAFRTSLSPVSPQRRNGSYDTGQPCSRCWPIYHAVATSAMVVLFTSTAGAGIHAALGHIEPGYALSLSI